MISDRTRYDDLGDRRWADMNVGERAVAAALWGFLAFVLLGAWAFFGGVPFV